MITLHSAYNWTSASDEEALYEAKVSDLILNDFVLLNDLFHQINEKSDQDDSVINDFLEAQGQLNGMNALFAFGQIIITMHQTELEDLMYEVLVASRGRALSIEDRVQLIKKELLQKLLILKE